MKSTIAIFAILLGVAAAGLVGGWHEMNANSVEAKKAVMVAELRANEMSNDVFHKKDHSSDFSPIQGRRWSPLRSRLRSCTNWLSKGI